VRDLILFNDVRKYQLKKGHIFTDFEKATLIYQSAWSLPVKHNALRELLNRTKDVMLIQQIQERIAWDDECISRIQGMVGEYIYHLTVWDSEDRQYQPAGYFGTFETTQKFAAGSGRKYVISVIEIGSVAEWEEYCGDSAIASINFNEDNEITMYWNKTYIEICNTLGIKRFENAYVHIPHPYVEGDIIKVIGTDKVGIVRFCGMQERKELERIQSTDYSDTYITIEVLYKGMLFAHEHASPLNLEYANLPNDDPRKEVLESASYLVTGQGYIQEFQMACEKYIERYEGSPQR